MPIWIIILTIFCILVIAFIVRLFRKVLNKEKFLWGEACVLALTVLVFIGTFGGFLNISRFVSETNTPSVEIYGSSIWNGLAFFNLLGLLILCVISGIRLSRKTNKR